MPKPPSDGVKDTITCLECGQPFTVWRDHKNRNAMIRFCPDCHRLQNRGRQMDPQHRGPDSNGQAQNRR